MEIEKLPTGVSELQFSMRELKSCVVFIYLGVCCVKTLLNIQVQWNKPWLTAVALVTAFEAMIFVPPALEQ